MGDKTLAAQGIKAAIALDEAARDKLQQIVARKKLQGANVEEERADIAELNREVADARDLLAEVEAADVVVSAPTVDEIRSVVEMEHAIQGLAVKDATIQADLEFITKGIAAAGQLRGKVKV